MLRGKIGELAKRVKVGFVGACEKYYTTDTRYPMIRTTNLSEHGINYEDLKYVTEEFFNKNKKSQLHDCDVLIARFGTSGTACVYHGGEAQCLNAIIVEPDIETTIPEYLAIAINSRGVREQVNRRIVGSTQAILNTKVLSDIEIELPSLSEQKKIVGVFESIQKLQLLQTKMLVELDALIKARFVETFGEPIDNPMNWPVKKMKELSSLITNGNTPKGGSENYVDQGIVFLRSQNVWRNRIDLSDVAYIDEETHRKLRKSSVHHNDILITKTGRINTENSSLGRAALYTGEDNSANINGHVYLIRLNKEVDPRFVVTILTGEAYRKYIRKVCVGGIDKRQINLDQVEDFPIILPPLELQVQFSEFVEQVDKSKVVVKKSLNETQLLLDNLMQDYFG